MISEQSVTKKLDQYKHFIQRADYGQWKKEVCMFCQSRKGYDYLIRKKYF